VFQSAGFTGGAPRILFETERHTVDIADMRPLAAAFTLDREGFELRRDHTTVADLYDDAAVEKIYYPEIETLLRSATGASRVIGFDATRCSDAGTGAQNRDDARGLASRVHVEYTKNRTHRRARTSMCRRSP
jgi:hypothetical protein